MEKDFGPTSQEENGKRDLVLMRLKDSSHRIYRCTCDEAIAHGLPQMCDPTFPSTGLTGIGVLCRKHGSRLDKVSMCGSITVEMFVAGSAVIPAVCFFTFSYRIIPYVHVVRTTPSRLRCSVRRKPVSPHSSAQPRILIAQKNGSDKIKSRITKDTREDAPQFYASDVYSGHIYIQL